MMLTGTCAPRLLVTFTSTIFLSSGTSPSQGRHPMFTSDPVMIEHAGLCDVSGCDEEVVAAAVNETAFEEESDVSNTDYESVRRRN
jgi:hypothetical protein